jgi:hypothetical protein
MSEMKEFKATVKEVTPLVDADMGEALGELKYVSVTFAIEGAQEDLGPVVRAEFKEPEKFSGSDEGLQRADNAAGCRLGVISFAMEYLRLPC